MSTRRRFLQASGAAVAAALLPPYVQPAVAAPAALEPVRLPGGLLAVLGPDANALAAEGEGGLILIDGGAPEWSEALLGAVGEAFAAQPIGTLLNTHWHPEQTGSNVALGSRGTEIVAHENTKLWLGREVWVRWSDRKYPAMPAAGLPRKTFYESCAIEVAGRKLDCRYLLNAHTDGDICVRFAEENVLVAGGAVSNRGWPIIDWWTGGWLGGMLDAYDVLLGIADQATRIVPSRGPVMSLADLKAQQEMYLTIFDRLQAMLRKSYSLVEVLAAKPTAEFDAEWGAPEQFVSLAFHSLLGHLRDVHDTRLRNIP